MFEHLNSKHTVGTRQTKFGHPTHFSRHYWYRQRCMHDNIRKCFKNKCMICLLVAYKKLANLLCTRERVLTWIHTTLLHLSCCPNGLSYIARLWQRKTKTSHKSTVQQGGGGAEELRDGPNPNPNDNYEPFSRCGTEWLDSNQILKCSLYLLHTQYQNAKHQNLYGLTHTHTLFKCGIPLYARRSS